MSETNTTTPPAPTPKLCWCGCGGTTKSKFVPGHDARFHSKAKNHARDKVAGKNPVLPTFIHAEAEADFMFWMNRELPLAQAKADEKAREAAAKTAEKNKPAPEAKPEGEPEAQAA